MNPIISMMAFQVDLDQCAIEIKIKEGWHIYWENPGDTGMATQLESEGVLVFPIPDVFLSPGGLKSYGYAQEVVLFVRDAPHDIPLELHWLACTKETCIPGRQSLPIQHKNKDATREGGMREWSEAKSKLPVSFSGVVRPLSDASGLFIGDVVEVFPDVATELEIEQLDYTHEGVSLYWKDSKPQRGKLIVRLRGRKTPYKIVW